MLGCYRVARKRGYTFMTYIMKGMMKKKMMLSMDQRKKVVIRVKWGRVESWLSQSG